MNISQSKVNQTISHFKSSQTQDLAHYLDKHRYLFLEGLQYVCLLIAWYYQTQWKPEKTGQFFLLYKRVFKLRRLFRLGYSISFIPNIKEAYEDYCMTKSGEKIFQLLRYCFKFLFYIVDNIAVILDVVQYKKYYLFRRASYSLLALALTFSTIQYLIRLRQSFKKQAQLKTRMVGQLTPKQVLTELNTLDEDRLKLYLQLFRCLGDLCPALERTNVTQIILRTRINKGTVALSGLTAIIMQILRQFLK